MASRYEVFELLSGIESLSREQRGNISRVSKRKLLNQAGTTYLAMVEYESGKKVEGICKEYERGQGSGWLEAATKQALVLSALEMQDNTTGKLLDVVVGVDESDRVDKVMIVRGRIEGMTLRDFVSARPLSEVRRRVGVLFSQLAQVSSDGVLINVGMAYCGDLSARNVIESGRGYEIIEWDGLLGQGGMSDLTAGYVAPEVINTEGAVAEVQADTYSLGCVLARALIGQERFRSIVPVGDFAKFLTFDKIKNLVPREAHDFFAFTLRKSNRDRVFSGASNPTVHYQRSKELFMGRLS
ncbi:hypothetical protein A2634_01070 [Candidatus Amesbacteria bacterium RIFCSPHIGHO2_01_FULL_48_32]|uniref:Protein kinase domain-containing protein n=1 Tax=Candidatus Amesbacteria bacterium RIFCSPLOWO2_01_FULL_48_25 TaxID=1797259 RepID=A0A1F4ZBQ0_9BACT|nr:MAG: hypothetical protein A2634_01070 [Candidatus Amesbacteria bacterium RIFCSPHIGHO2_01_FULL_48_32]OGD03631.1 MAG: hypothetical protein A2989_03050 [Candidatus Amesbacteria bacterium RIFCSPLOWO2_01_FULL_48_25]